MLRVLGVGVAARAAAVGDGLVLLGRVRRRARAPVLPQVLRGPARGHSGRRAQEAGARGARAVTVAFLQKEQASFAVKVREGLVTCSSDVPARRRRGRRPFAALCAAERRVCTGLARDAITPAPTAKTPGYRRHAHRRSRSQAKQIATARSPDAVCELWLRSRLCSALRPRSASSRAARPCRPMPRALASRPWRCARPSLAAIGASRCGDGPEAGLDNPRTLVGR